MMVICWYFGVRVFLPLPRFWLYQGEEGICHTRLQSNAALLPVPYTFNAPLSPTALGR
jgi:hypothetical protein